MKIQLLWFPGCPHADIARQKLREALDGCGLPVAFEDIDVTSEGAPEALRGWGSPTILVEGRDVAGAPRPAGASCRLYQHPDDVTRGAPPAAMIRAALDRARTEDPR